jgi:hypothetical protein
VRRAGLILVITALGSAVGVTWSAFSAATQNGGNVFTAAASFCAAPGTQTVTADADAFARQASAGTNFGALTTLRVQSGQTLIIILAPDNERSLVHFALPAVPAHCTVTGATLRLNASSASAGRTLQAFRASAAWTETAVTWSNQPGTTGSAAATASGTGWREWDVTTQAQAMYAGSNHGFVIRDAQEGSVLTAAQVFSSREGANPPQLLVTFG